MPHPFGFDIAEEFRTAHNKPWTGIDEDVFYGPINALLHMNFSPANGFMVVPRPVPIDCHDEQFLFTLEFDVRHRGKPVLIVLVKPSRSLSLATCRRDADSQMRALFANRYKECSLDVLHGLVFFGTRVAFYKIERETGKWSPPRPSDRESGKVYLEPSEDIWANDVLDEPVAEHLKDVFGRIFRECNELTT
jgi:hypothetical protein